MVWTILGLLDALSMIYKHAYILSFSDIFRIGLFQKWQGYSLEIAQNGMHREDCLDTGYATDVSS